MNNLKQKCGLCNKDYKHLAIVFFPNNGMNHAYLVLNAKFTISSLIKDYLDNKHLLSFKTFLFIIKGIFFNKHLYIRYDCNECEVSSDWEIKDNVKYFTSLHNKHYKHLWSIIHTIGTSDYSVNNKYIWYLEQREFGRNNTINNLDYVYYTKHSWGDHDCYYNLTYEEACKAYKTYRNNLIFG